MRFQSRHKCEVISYVVIVDINLGVQEDKGTLRKNAYTTIKDFFVKMFVKDVTCKNYIP